MSVNTILLTINENGSFHESGDLEISESGYSFGDIVITVVPLSYSQYEQETDRRVAETFPRRPTEASGTPKIHTITVIDVFVHTVCSLTTVYHAFLGSDFESEIIRFTFSAGLESDPPRTVLGSSLGRRDSDEETAEGFVLLVAVDEASLDPRDVGRVSVEDDLILVSIVDNNNSMYNTRDALLRECGSNRAKVLMMEALIALGTFINLALMYLHTSWIQSGTLSFQMWYKVRGTH